MKATTTKEIKIVVEKHKPHDNTDMLSRGKLEHLNRKISPRHRYLKTPIVNSCSIGLITISPPSLNLA